MFFIDKNINFTSPLRTEFQMVFASESDQIQMAN